MSREAHGESGCFVASGLWVLKPRLRCNEGMDPSSFHLSLHTSHVQFIEPAEVEAAWEGLAEQGWKQLAARGGLGQLGKNLSSSHNNMVRKPPIVLNRKFLGSQGKINWEPFCHAFPLCESNNHFCLFPQEVSWQRNHLLQPVGMLKVLCPQQQLRGPSTAAEEHQQLLPWEIKNPELIDGRGGVYFFGFNAKIFLLPILLFPQPLLCN